jgi:NAD(P)H-dependent FMN reductase
MTERPGGALSDVLRVLLISGSTRGGSTNTAALATAAALAPAQVAAVRYQGLAALPAFNPDLDGYLLPPAAAELRREIGAAAAVLFCTPEYAGSLPGSFKNLLDWTVAGGEMYTKPVAWINVAAPGRGAGAAATLATVLGYLGTEIIGQACRHVPVSRAAVTPDGLISDPQFAAAVSDLWQVLVGRLTVTGP